MIIKSDCIEWLRTLAPRSVDLILTDPAYESLEKHRDHGTTTRLRTWFPIFSNARFADFFLEAWRVLRTDAHLYMFVDQETMFVVKPIAEAHGFKLWKPLVWDKMQIGMGYHYRCQYEFVLFFDKNGGGRKLNDFSVGDVLTVPPVRGGYPTEKPVELLRTLIRQSTEAGQLVIDPFMGSGSAGEAAVREGRRFYGCDVSDTAIEAASARFSKTVLELGGEFDGKRDRVH